MKRRHTKRDLVTLFKERGLRANRLLGQHFLVDHNVLDFLCRAGDVGPHDVILEIGAGTGLLTEHLARLAARVVAVEIDGRLSEIARDYLAGADNVLWLDCDIHGERRHLHPRVAAALDAERAPGGVLKVVSNLPYCISSDLLASLVELPWPVERMVLTVQEEFANRLAARAGTRDYSALSVLVRSRAKVERLRRLPPSVFWPVPKVGSAVVRVVRDEGRSSKIRDPQLFAAVVRALFSGRRKTAAAALRTTPRRRFGKDRVAAALAAAAIPKAARADGLSVGQVVALANALAESADEHPPGRR